jgi:hypothetical protein
MMIKFQKYQGKGSCQNRSFVHGTLANTAIIIRFYFYFCQSIIHVFLCKEVCFFQLLFIRYKVMLQPQLAYDLYIYQRKTNKL